MVPSRSGPPDLTMRVIGWTYVVLGVLGAVVGSALLLGPGLLVLAWAASALVVGLGLTLRGWGNQVAVDFAMISVATSIAGVLLGEAISTVPLLVNTGILFYLRLPEEPHTKTRRSHHGS